jgi:3-phenylpropionate/cinnamic acid dioxygenase small subunit
MEKWWEIQQFLFREAALLDERKYREWLELLTQDVVYLVPQRYNRLGKGRNEEWPIEQEIDGLPLLEEDRTSLTLRVERFYLGSAWSEMPPSRTRHLITNIRMQDAMTSAHDVEVDSNFLVFRSRLAGRTGEEENIVAGTRHDILRQGDGGWKLARRTALLDSAVLNSHNLSFFL